MVGAGVVDSDPSHPLATHPGVTAAQGDHVHLC